MNRSENREASKLVGILRAHVAAGVEPEVIGWAARGFSALARSSLRSRNEILTLAAGWPAVVEHPDFIV